MKERFKRYVVARRLNVSNGHLSDILNGKVEMGKRTAKEIGRLIGQPWNKVIAMEPDTVEAELIRAAGGE